MLCISVPEPQRQGPYGAAGVIQATLYRLASGQWSRVGLTRWPTLYLPTPERPLISDDDDPASAADGAAGGMSSHCSSPAERGNPISISDWQRRKENT